MASRRREAGGGEDPAPILQLPAEVLSTVFSKLCASNDVASAAAVCQRWRVLAPSSITRLDLSHRMRLTPQALITALPAFPNLLHLHLPLGFLRPADDSLLLAIAGHCVRLQSLEASGFRLQSLRFTPRAIQAVLDACPNLSALKLGTRSWQGSWYPAAALFLAPAPPRPQLRSLCLERCSLPAPASIPLTHVSQLEELTLAECNFPQRGVLSEAVADMTALFTLVGQIRSLTSLHLSFLQCPSLVRMNPDGGDGERLWLPSLSNLRGLRALTLCGLWQTRSVPACWARALTALQDLRLLRMREFSGLQSVCLLTSLTSLAVSHCRAAFLPEQLTALTKLTSFAFTHAQELRHLPSFISHLPNLAHLDLTGNSRLQTLPQTFSRLTALRSLRLSGCRALGSLPRGLEALPALDVLDVSRCSEHLLLPPTLRPTVPQSSVPQPPFLWCPLSPSLQTHPAVRNSVSVDAEVVEYIPHLPIGLWPAWEEEDDVGWVHNERVWDFGYDAFEDDYDDVDQDWWDVQGDPERFLGQELDTVGPGSAGAEFLGVEDFEGDDSEFMEYGLEYHADANHDADDSISEMGLEELDVGHGMVGEVEPFMVGTLSDPIDGLAHAAEYYEDDSIEGIHEIEMEAGAPLPEEGVYEMYESVDVVEDQDDDWDVYGL